MMAMMAGRATFIRFRIAGHKPPTPDTSYIEMLERRSAGKSRIASADGIDVGWIAGGHVLDTDFTLEKNIVNGALTFGFRVDNDKIPNDLMQSYTAIELKALSANNPSGFASAKQKREAKQAARERLEEEAKDGRFRKRTAIPILWDHQTGEVLYGSASFTHVARFASHFQQTFGVQLEAVTAGRLAFEIADKIERTKAVDDATPERFTPDSPPEYAWIADESSRDWLGNEFLLWLWYHLDQVDDTLTLADKSEAAIMMARSLVMHCPRGSTGEDGFRSEGPTRLPEAKRAAQSGKLPRKAGLTIVRHDQQYEFALNAEMMSVNAARLPNMPEDITDARARLEERVTQIRNLVETTDLVFGAFLDCSLAKAKWIAEADRIRSWLGTRMEAKAA